MGLNVKHIIILICIWLNLSGISAQESRMQFNYLTIDDGLSSNTIRCFCRDSKGYIWIGTRNGLNRFDGYTITTFFANTNKPGALSNNIIPSIYEDKNGNLWVGTADGLNLYDPSTESFKVYRNVANDDNSLNDSHVTGIIEDKDNNLWFITFGKNGGINRWVPEQHKFIRYYLQNVVADTLEHYLLSIAADSKGNFWISNLSNNLYRFNPKTGKSYAYPMPFKNPTSAISKTIFVDNQDKIWISAFEEGFFSFTPATGKFEKFENKNDILWANSNWFSSSLQADQQNLFVCTNQNGFYRYNLFTNKIEKVISINENTTKSLNSNAINTIYKDREGILWVGTANNGVNYFNPNINQIALYQKSKTNTNSLCYNEVSCIFEDHERKIWLGTRSGGISVFDPSTGNFNNYYHDPNFPDNATANPIHCLTEDKDYNMLIGTWAGGLFSFDRKTGKFLHISLNKTGIYSVMHILTDHHGYVWAGIYNEGIDVLNSNKKVIKSFRHSISDSKSLSDKLINYLYQDKEKNIWIGFQNGALQRYDSSNNNFITCNTFPKVIYAFFQDSKNRYWCATDYGLTLVDRNGKTIEVYGQSAGLSNDLIKNISEDSSGKLWLSTNDGISCFNPTTKKFRNFNKYDGLQGKFGSLLITKPGEIYFGGYNGFNRFYPGQIKEMQPLPNVSITNFLIDNKPVPIGIKGSPLRESISVTSEITLTHNQNFITFGFTAIGFANQEANTFSYIMEGYDKIWNYTDASHRFATYTNLTEGNYTFRVKVANKDGLWNETAKSIKVIILPPWWRTWWFRITSVLLIILLIFWYIHQREKDLVRSKILLEEKIDIRTKKLVEVKEVLEIQNMQLSDKNIEIEQISKKLHEADQLKLNFFTNISHELRTPLTLIISPLEKLISEGKNVSSETMNEMLVLMSRNAKRLLSMVNQILDIKKIDENAYLLEVSENDIVKFVENIVTGFVIHARKHDITLEFQSAINQSLCWFDPSVIEKVLFNLLSNAIKFTPDNGKICVSLIHEGNWIFITVTDTGNGISPDKIEHIFDRFYQAGNKSTKNYEGSGIGLAFSKELITMHMGHIEVESTEFKGTSFTVSFPVSKDPYLKPGIVFSSTSDVSLTLPKIIEDEIGDLEQDECLNHHGNKKKPVLLIVEDNRDLIKLLATEMGLFYRVILAENGQIGWEKASESLPDLVLSDVMMPKMDGIELCQKLKTDQRTSHIPVILLTARSSEDNQVEGLHIGADDYISKPFNMNVLKAKISSLIANRTMLRETFKNYLVENIQNETLNKIDENFLNKLSSIIENNLHDQKLSADLLSKEIGMSRSVLYMKLNSITGMSVNIYIRNVRLRKATELLKEHKYSITAISDLVGFSDANYFSKCFKKAYKISPLQYFQSFS
jgi:signal transduction histidine kinase/ligand-binding sensor domain-containing protein/DNA-binding response OmpR family regulator